MVSLPFSPYNIESPTLACNKGALISLNNLRPHPIYCIVTEDICPIKPCNRLFFRDKFAFVCDALSVAKTVESATEGIAADIFAYIFFDKLFI